MGRDTEKFDIRFCGCLARKVKLIPKPILGPDRGLQLALVKPKSLVVAG